MSTGRPGVAAQAIAAPARWGNGGVLDGFGACLRRFEGFIILVIVCALAIDIRPILIANWGHGQRVAFSVALCALFFLELLVRGCAHAAQEGSLRKGLRICFESPIRWVDLVCLVLELVSLADLLSARAKGRNGKTGLRGATLRPGRHTCAANVALEASVGDAAGGDARAASLPRA